MATCITRIGNNIGNNENKGTCLSTPRSLLFTTRKEAIPSEMILLRLFAPSLRTKFNPLIDVYSLVLEQNPSVMSRIPKLIEGSYL